MDSHLYWITALTLAVVLLMIYFEEKLVKIRSAQRDNSFLAMLVYVIFFCLQDTFWGLCNSDIILGDKIFFISSSIFHLSMIFSTYFWLKFILSYLGDRVKYKRFYMNVVGMFVVIKIVLVTANVFYPVLFTIEDGVYVTQFLRPMSFYNQYVIYLGCGIVTLLCSIKAKKEERDNLLTVFWFSLAPIIMGIFQLMYPQAPFYSIGYFFGCFIVHIFIVSKERDSLARGAILDAVAGIYYTMHLFNLKDNIMEDFIESEIVNSLIEDRRKPQETITHVMSCTVTDEYLDSVLEFVDLSTLQERLEDKKIISIDFIGKFHGWTRASFIPIERDAEGKLLSVMYTTQIIDEQKKKEQDMFLKSVTDPLTGLLNRRAYDDCLKEHPENNPDMVYLSVDVNGLKNVNDTKGHVAGDELIVGAAHCIKQSFGSYGRVFRVGGDEFVAIFSATEKQLKKVKEDFMYLTGRWSGKYIDKIEISCGYVERREFDEVTISEIIKTADKRMYMDKALFYQTKGIDRRGQK